jgi:hypothetical protein
MNMMPIKGKEKKEKLWSSCFGGSGQGGFGTTVRNKEINRYVYDLGLSGQQIITLSDHLESR